jgi:hypothetical protein
MTDHQVKKINKEYVSDLDGVQIILPERKPAGGGLYPAKSDEALQKRLGAQAAALIQEYSKMKPFILDVYLRNRLAREHYSPKKIAELRVEMEKEMQAFLQEALAQSVRVQNPAGGALEKDLVSTELERTIEALESRIAHYRVHYVSHQLQNKYATASQASAGASVN